MSKRRTKTFVKTILLASLAVVATAAVDTMWSYTGSNLSASDVRQAE